MHFVCLANDFKRISFGHFKVAVEAIQAYTIFNKSTKTPWFMNEILWFIFTAWFYSSEYYVSCMIEVNAFIILVVKWYAWIRFCYTDFAMNKMECGKLWSDRFFHFSWNKAKNTKRMKTVWKFLFQTYRFDDYGVLQNVIFSVYYFVRCMYVHMIWALMQHWTKSSGLDWPHCLVKIIIGYSSFLWLFWYNDDLFILEKNWLIKINFSSLFNL